jgi:hypothetical protein
MRRLFLACAALGLAVSALAATSSANAAPYHVIRWSSGYCSVWDEFWPAPGWPTDYNIVSGQLPTMDAALETKGRMIQERHCRPEQ